MKEQILLKRGYLLAQNNKHEEADIKNAAYYAAKLLNQFGILVDKPKLVTSDHVKQISTLFGVNIPRSFYSNPQDLRYFSSSELLIEQLVSYFMIEDVTGVYSEDRSSFERYEVFRKNLPNYEEGKEVEFRNYQVVNDDEAAKILIQVYKDLQTYTRKWSEAESNEFAYLYQSKVYDAIDLKSKDNAIEMYKKFRDARFAKSLDQKDVVKMSIELKGEVKDLKFTEDEKTFLRTALENAHKVPLTKKQSKFVNSLIRNLKLKETKTNNDKSPYKQAKKLLKENNVVEAAKVFARNGSLLERNLVWLLSRSSKDEASTIIDLIKIKSPAVALQFIDNLLSQTERTRTFKYYKNRKLISYEETENEALYRKSIISSEIKELLKDKFIEKIYQYYLNLPKIGKVYINPMYHNIAAPLNTSASGSGISVYPTGSRLQIEGDNVRFFCHWNKVHDIDTNGVFIDGKGNAVRLTWSNYHSKPLGNMALHSGDDRSSNGVEYIDAIIPELVSKGYVRMIYTLSGYTDKISAGEVYCGYQNKKDLKTVAWSTKNIAMKIRITADSNSAVAFGVDLLSKEIIILNTALNSNSRIVTDTDINISEALMDSKLLDKFNVAKLARLRSTEVVDNPEEADIVFDRDYLPLESQKVVRPYDIEKIVSLLNN